ncbi:hypothetical protein [Dactylosporangium sp. NPDC000521]|uniref:hypothetical protein n=1 Tax=Dactylosporangium sp. NPDC000521 TaxID=3363975 RepID=UPI0036AE951E
MVPVITPSGQPAPIQASTDRCGALSGFLLSGTVSLNRQRRIYASADLAAG